MKNKEIIDKIWQEYWVPILFNDKVEGLDVQKLKEVLYNYHRLKRSGDSPSEIRSSANVTDGQPRSFYYTYATFDDIAPDAATGQDN